MMVKDMARLNPATVKLWNGKQWTQCLGASKSARFGDEIQFTLRSGERIGCTPSHQWPTQRGLVRAADIQVGDVINTCRLPEPETPEQPTALPDDIGWFVGMYLAEGSRDSGGTIQIASHSDEAIGRAARIGRLVGAFGGTCRVHRLGGMSSTVNIDSGVLSAILNLYLSGRTAKDKHLSMRCWRRSDGFLDSLLTGYLEGDGHHDAANRRWRLGFTRNYSLEADMRTLCARLGYRLHINPSWATLDERRYATFRGELRKDESNHGNRKAPGEVVGICGSKARYFYDVGVADDPHTFALASGILTHNSKPNPMPESCTDRPTKAHEYLFLLTKTPRYYYDADAIREAAEYGRRATPPTPYARIARPIRRRVIIASCSEWANHRLPNRVGVVVVGLGLREQEQVFMGLRGAVGAAFWHGVRLRVVRQDA